MQQGGLLGASVSIARVLLLGSCQDVAAVFIRSVVLRSGVLPLGGGAQRASPEPFYNNYDHRRCWLLGVTVAFGSKVNRKLMSNAVVNVYIS